MIGEEKKNTNREVRDERKERNEDENSMRQVAKRNCAIVIYRMLLEKTSESGNRLTAADVDREFRKQYGMGIDRRTVYRVVDDLAAMGVDVCMDTGGYYVGKRLFTEGEFGLLIDGIESVGSITPDDKVAIYEKLCYVMGTNPDDIDNYLYEGDGATSDGDAAARAFDIICQAIKEDRKVGVYWCGVPFCRKFLDDVSDEEYRYFIEQYDCIGDSYILNPYKLFRNGKGEMYLLFYMDVLGKTHVGTIPVSSVATKDWIWKSDRKRDRVDVHALFDGLDLSDFEEVDLFREGETVYTARVGVIPGRRFVFFDVLALDDWCIEKTALDEEQTLYEITYKQKNEDEIFRWVTEDTDSLAFLPGSPLYDRAVKLKEKLSSAY